MPASYTPMDRTIMAGIKRSKMPAQPRMSKLTERRKGEAMGGTDGIGIAAPSGKSMEAKLAGGIPASESAIKGVKPITAKAPTMGKLPQPKPPKV